MSPRPTSRSGPVAPPPATPGVPSPCINVCRMDAASGLCAGCQRTLDEIAAWGGMADDDKRAVWRRIERRRAQPTRSAAVPAPR